ncbi:hypothetical protein DY245_31860 [Streptomyces inhibens]|uniref:Uncharacterized protein n=1 Tax=Streptomyces inhibens TaxID=2293571 RepID=A0A371PWJ1_STRIH|nr:hypothetical protein DY245_31860 [Streptomyces inhibens]
MGVAGVRVDDQAAAGDVVVDLLCLGADLKDFLAREPRHGVGGPCPFVVDIGLHGLRERDLDAC